MTINLARARVIEALKNIEYTPLGKAFAYWITQVLHQKMEDILDFQINMDSSPNISMSVTILQQQLQVQQVAETLTYQEASEPVTYTTIMQRRQVLAFGLIGEEKSE